GWGEIVRRDRVGGERLDEGEKDPREGGTVEAAVSAADPDPGARHARHYSIEPALSPTITRKLNRVIPANLQIDARWGAIQKARQALKERDREQAPSPSVMIAWAVVRAMEKHAPFRRLILEDDRIVQNDNFDLGIA